MRQIGGSTFWECTACHLRVELAYGQRPSSMIVTAAGQHREQIEHVGNDIVHRCIIQDRQGRD